MNLGRIFRTGSIVLAIALASGQAYATSLVVGVYPSNPPWENKTPSGTFEGFEVDLVHEIGKRLGMDVELQDYGFQALFSAVSSDRIDMAICSITITDERLKNQSFTQGYYDADSAIASTKDTPIKSLGDLRGKATGAIAATVQEAWVKENKEKYGIAKLQTYNTLQNLLLDAQSGRIDAAIGDYTAIQFSLLKMPSLKIVERIPSGTPFAVMMKKGSPLLETVNAAISDMKKDGTMAAIHKKWIGIDPDPNSSVTKVSPIPAAQ